MFINDSVAEDGRSVCGICNKVFSKSSQLKLHINIHYFERPFKCESCGVSFRTKGHLTKHERSVSHHNKVSNFIDKSTFFKNKIIISQANLFCTFVLQVSMTSTFGAATMLHPCSAISCTTSVMLVSLKLSESTFMIKR